jgi:hypothetical protein
MRVGRYLPGLPCVRVEHLEAGRSGFEETGVPGRVVPRAWRWLRRRRSSPATGGPRRCNLRISLSTPAALSVTAVPSWLHPEPLEGVRDGGLFDTKRRADLGLGRTPLRHRRSQVSPVDESDARRARGVPKASQPVGPTGFRMRVVGPYPARGHNGLNFSGFNSAHPCGPLSERRTWESLQLAPDRCSV